MPARCRISVTDNTAVFVLIYNSKLLYWFTVVTENCIGHNQKENNANRPSNTLDNHLSAMIHIIHQGQGLLLLGVPVLTQDRYVQWRVQWG
jgi:hypothetical protein